MRRVSRAAVSPDLSIPHAPMTHPAPDQPETVTALSMDNDNAVAGVVTRVQSLGSGSSGNTLLIEHGQTCLLLDCGVPFRTIAGALRNRGRAIADLDAILITHEHIDHIRSLPSMPGPDTPVLASAGTFGATRIADGQWRPVAPSKPFTIAGATIWALPVPHDAAEPCGYMIELPDATISVLTDLGSWRDALLDPLLASDLIVLEANHDVDMLRRGPYPPYLKRRVASALGHLSNDDSGTVLAEVARRTTRSPEVWLAHLSQTNNHPETAGATVEDAIRRIDRDLPVTALPRRSTGPAWIAGAVRPPAARPRRPRAGSIQLTMDGF